MDNTLKLVIKHINLALNNEKSTLKIPDEKAFYILVKENGLSGLVYHAITEENISKNLYNYLLKDFLAYVKSDSLQLELIDKLKTLFTNNNIQYIFLKGSHLKHLYPETYMRAMGDIDILVKKDQMQQIHQLLKQNNIKLTSRSPQHDVFLTENNLNIEIHPGFTDLKNPGFEPLLNNVWNYVNNSNKLDATYELMYLNYHLAKHFYTGGVGIRSILDIGIYLKHYLNNINEELLVKLASETNSLLFVKTIIKLNEELFNIESNFLFMKDFIIDENTLNKVITYITKSGIHGWGSDFNSFSARVVKEEKGNKKLGKLRLILSRAFPKYKEMKEIYPVLKKAPVLLPILWIIRLFKLVFIRGKTNLKKIKEIKEVDNTDETKEVLNSIGL